MRTILTSIMLLLFVACTPDKSPPSITLSQRNIKFFSDSAYQYCVSEGLNRNFYFLVDLNQHSGLKRFYVWDFEKNTAIDTFMVSHGCGKSTWYSDKTKDNPTISNEPESHCSSVGRYLIRERGFSSFGIGIKYSLQGIDVTNNNAYKRAIVLHSWDPVTDYEVYPMGTAEGWGCPAVSNNTMRYLDTLLKSSDRVTLMWIIK